MIIRIKPSALRQTEWWEYAIRFVFGGLSTVLAGLVANYFGPAIGGLFLAFPAIFCASATLVERHEHNRKQRLGLRGRERGLSAAALDAVGASLGSFGLVGFGTVIWLLGPTAPVTSLVLASATWAVIALMLWGVRKRVRMMLSAPGRSG
jgi:Protein of unknown function (DUF3147)